MRLFHPMPSLFVAVLALTTSLALAQQATKTESSKPAESKTHTLTRAEFDKLLAQPDQLLIVDIRRPDEIISIGSFPVYLSIQLADLEKNTAWIPKDRRIVTVSNHAARAGKAGDLLSAKGFNVVGRIGVQNYEAEGGKLSKIAPKAAQPASTEKAH